MPNSRSPRSPLPLTTLAFALSSTSAFLSATSAVADPCRDLCEIAFEGCEEVANSACDETSDAAGDLAGDAIGGIFGGITKKVTKRGTKQACLDIMNEKLGACRAARGACYGLCPPEGSGNVLAEESPSEEPTASTPPSIYSPPPQAPPSPAAELTPYWVVKPGAQLRTSPFTESPSLGELSVGKEVKVVEQTPDYRWFKVALRGNRFAFVESVSLSLEPPPAAEQRAAERARLAGVGVIILSGIAIGSTVEIDSVIAITDSGAVFKMNARKGKRTVVVTHPLYKPWKKRIRVSGNQEVESVEVRQRATSDSMVFECTPSNSTVVLVGKRGTRSCGEPILLRKGRHRFTISYPGFATANADVANAGQGEQLSREVILQPLSAVVTVQSDPPDARVEVITPHAAFDGNYSAGRSWPFPVGDNRVRVAQPGFAPLAFNVQISEKSALKKRPIEMLAVLALEVPEEVTLEQLGYRQPLTELPDRPFLPEFELKKRWWLFPNLGVVGGLAGLVIGLVAIKSGAAGALMFFGGAGLGILIAALIPKKKIPLEDNLAENAEIRNELYVVNAKIEAQNQVAQEQFAAQKTARDEAIRRNEQEDRGRVMDAAEAAARGAASQYQISID